MPLPKTGNHGRPRTARQEKPAKAKIVTGGDGKKMVGKKMARQGGGSVHHLPATHVPAILLSILVAAERSEAALGDSWFTSSFGHSATERLELADHLADPPHTFGFVGKLSAAGR